MKIHIHAIGKIKEAYLKSGLNEYAKRINRFAKLNIVEKEESKNTDRAEKMIAAAKLNEGEDLLSSAKGCTIALDSTGEMLTSEEIASLIKSSRDKGEELTFFIGGSDGLGDNVLSKADRIISFGKVTYPHQLMRLILTEQIYRAFAILANTPYHK